MSKEVKAIAERYARRQTISAWQYSRLNPVVNLMQQERQRALIKLFSKVGITDLVPLKVLEIGAGSGGNLLELIQMGASPQNLVANELLPERVKFAKQILPESVKMFASDATQLKFKQSSFDIIYQSTVFSSILDNALQEKIASLMWQWVKPGGGILWYDFTFNNPNNPDVRGVPLKRVKSLFPQGHIFKKKITLAPPLARKVASIHPNLYTIFNMFPFLRTHILCYIQKP